MLYLMFLPFYAMMIWVTYSYVRQPTATLPVLAQALLQMIALVLLFVGPARRWYGATAR